MPPKKENFAVLLNSQVNLLDRIVNFKEQTILELPADDKLEYFEARLELLESIWSDFFDRHDTLTGQTGDIQQHEYFVQEGYVTAQKEYIYAKAFLKSQIKRQAVAEVGV